MEITKIITRRTNFIFGFLCLYPVLSFIVSIPAFVPNIAEAVGVDSLSLMQQLKFYFGFAIPQFLYPVLSLLIILAVPHFINFKVKDLIPTSKVPVFNYIVIIFMFLGISTVATYIVNYIIYLMEKIGFQIPSMEDYFTKPVGIIQTIIFFIVITVLPAFCEEFIYRGVLMNSLKPLNSTMAVFISAIAFGLMHGTVQQIPFAFVMGLLFGYLSIKYNSIILPIVLHFINNSIASVFLLLEQSLDENLFSNISSFFDISIIILGLISTFIFFYKIGIKHKLQSSISNGKAFGSVFKSIFFWIFVVVYLGIMLLNILLPLIISAIQ